jgi:DNA-directed RNA polymerase specialized sigma subunit
VNGATLAADYKQAKAVGNRAECRRIQASLVIQYRGRVAALVRRMVTAPHWEAAEQVGLIGVLVANEKFDASRGDFWLFAGPFARAEIDTWLTREG